MCLRGTADGSLLGVRGTSAAGDLSHPDGGVPIPRNHVDGECESMVQVLYSSVVPGLSVPKQHNV